MLHSDITEHILGAFYHVHQRLGEGFLESTYERSMMIALRKRSLRAVSQAPITIHFEGEVVGSYRADLLVEDRVIVELKACRKLEPVHEAQLINLLRASVVEVGLILHFSTKPAFRRLILTNDRKPYVAQRALNTP